LLLGMWLAGGAVMAWIYAQNSHLADRVLDQPNPAANIHFQTLGPLNSRVILQYAASEQTRYIMESWETYQVILGVLFFFFFLFGNREDKMTLLIAIVIVGLALIERAMVTPELISQGRFADFTPPGGYFPGKSQLSVIQAAHSALELAKALVAVVLGVR